MLYDMENIISLTILQIAQVKAMVILVQALLQKVKMNMKDAINYFIKIL